MTGGAAWPKGDTPIMNDMHEANRRFWDATAAEWRLRDRDELWRRCPEEPEVAFEGEALETIREFLGGLEGKSACVIGSGDNYAAFALAGLGATVTSTDISERQLQVAGARADRLGLEIDFIRADAADLEPFRDGIFDLVCSTNGFFVWIADLSRVFQEVSRILRSGGYYIFYDIHPFQRPWKEQVQPIEMAKPYWDVGPYESDSGDEVYEFNWTLADILNPLSESGLIVRRVVESTAVNSRFWQGFSYGPGTDSSLMNWKNNPRAGLPAWLTIAAERP